MGSEAQTYDVPQSITEVVRQVAGRRGLWQGERRDVEEELTAHFLDGLDAGRSLDELIREFGDPQLAAGLVQIAKRRGRPAIWHAARWGLTAMTLPLLLACVLYTLSAARLYLAGADEARPWTADTRTAPRSDTWSLYRAASAGIPTASFDLALNDQIPQPWSEGLPRERALDIVSRDMLVQASRRTTLDLATPLAPAADLDGKAAFVRRQWQPNGPQLATLVGLARALCLDARHAILIGDPERSRIDLEAALAMAHQIRALRLPSADRAAAVIRHDVARTLLSPDLMAVARERDWTTVRRNLLEPIRLEGVRRAVADLVNLMYSDEGWASGRLNAEGIELMRRLKQWREPDVLERLARPAWYMNPASGDDVIREVDRLLRMAEASNGAAAVRDALQAEMKSLYGSRWQCFRYPALSVVLPDIAVVVEAELAARVALAEAARHLTRADGRTTSQPS